MKLLLADDETITRDGLMKGLAFDELGIDEIYQADNGLHALELVKTFEPDILLTDVRMPRMDGITLAEELLQKFPDICVIFMSGYSDKEYLKAAIKLKAVSYIEKPIRLQEVSEVLSEAVRTVRERKLNAHYQDISKRQREADTAFLLSLAGKASGIPADAFPIPPESVRFCCTALIRCYQVAGTEAEKSIDALFTDLFANLHLVLIHAVRQPFLYMMHLFSDREFSENQQHFLAGRMTELLKSQPFSFHLVFGKPVSSVYRLYDSYNTAIITLQRAFFQKENTGIRYESALSHGRIRELPDSLGAGNFRDLLLQKDRGAIKRFSDSLLSDILSSRELVPSQVRELYYRLFQEIKQAALTFHAQTAQSLQYSLWEHISAAATVFELHTMLESHADSLLRQIEENSSVSSPVYLIKTYISSHLSDANLSIKAISEAVRLSSSYLCTIFKAETGDTVTHYITELRMQKARELLLDPGNRISEISGMVGFSDSNYFSKAFRKAFGVSPSEFRDSLNG